MPYDPPKTKTSELTWEAPSFIHYPKSSLWYAVFGAVSGALLLFGWFSGGLLTLLTFAVLIASVLFYSYRKPENKRIALTGAGVNYGETFYPYRAIRKFWIIYAPPDVKALYLETVTHFNQTIKLELGRQNPVAVRDYLKKYLEEDLDQTESFPEMIARKFRF